MESIGQVLAVLWFNVFSKLSWTFDIFCHFSIQLSYFVIICEFLMYFQNFRRLLVYFVIFQYNTHISSKIWIFHVYPKFSWNFCMFCNFSNKTLIQYFASCWFVWFDLLLRFFHHSVIISRKFEQILKQFVFFRN